jgi:hypothetical protein
MLEICLDFKYLNNPNQIDFKSAKINLKMQLLCLKSSFYKENSMEPLYGDDDLEYECSIGEFYEQLLKMKEKYFNDDLVQFKIKLANETLKYHANEDYKYVEPYIIQEINKAVAQYQKNSLNKDKIILFMHQAISNIFENYQHLLFRIENAKKWFVKNEAALKQEEGIELLKRLNKIEKDYQETNMLITACLLLDDFDISFKKFKNYFNITNPDVLTLYNTLTNKYYKAVQHYKTVNDFAGVKLARNIYIKILNLLKNSYLLDENLILSLADINFINLNKELEIIDKLIPNDGILISKENKNKINTSPL